MLKLIICLFVLFILVVFYLAYKIHKGEREAVSNILLSFQHDFDEFQKSKTGQLIKKEVLLASKAYLENYASIHYPKLKPIFNFVFNKILLSTLIEENMPTVKAVRKEEGEVLINKAIDFGIAQGAELVYKESKNYDVGGNNELTHDSQLATIVQGLNEKAKGEGFKGAYVKYQDNFRDKRELFAGAFIGENF